MLSNLKIEEFLCQNLVKTPESGRALIWFLYCHIWEKLTFIKSLSFHLKQQVICISHSFQAQEALNEDF